MLLPTISLRERPETCSALLVLSEAQDAARAVVHVAYDRSTLFLNIIWQRHCFETLVNVFFTD